MLERRGTRSCFRFAIYGTPLHTHTHTHAHLLLPSMTLAHFSPSPAALRHAWAFFFSLSPQRART